MNLLDELARTDIAPALLAQVQALIEQQQARLAEKDFKIKALTYPQVATNQMLDWYVGPDNVPESPRCAANRSCITKSRRFWPSQMS